MTISAYVGLPGAGKSYGVVENVILPAIKAGRRVLTNIPMVRDEWLKQFQAAPEQFDIAEIPKDPDWWQKNNVAGAVVVLDELYKLWPAGLTAKNVRESDKSFLAEHRHMVDESGFSTEVVLVTQDLSQIASFARVLVETTFRVVKMSKLGLSKSYRVDVYTGAVTGPAPSKSRLDRQIFGAYKKETYALYRSHTKSVTGAAGNEKRVDGRFNVLGGLSVKLGLLLILVCCFITWFGFKTVAKGFGYGDEPAAAADQPPHVSPQQPAAVVAQPAKKSEFSFLSKAQAIIIVWNNGHWPQIDYRFKVVFADNEAVFSTRELSSLKYKLKPINECMVLIEGEDFNQWAMCPREASEKGWVESIATGSDVDTGA
ncbi:MAG TPA: zonular occludens toxin domain-containing protein [Cellvibrio sp.]|nr:zonular occludens toxin domain-containing protein [Cellvibrio sp.]